MSNLIFKAMMFAREAHRHQVRKYTGSPYHSHLAEVASLTAAVLWDEVAIATAWLHDTIEDCQLTPKMIESQFGVAVAEGVVALSDVEPGDVAP